MLASMFLKSSQRAKRRFHQERMKKKARHLYPHDRFGRLANHLAACSCECCGNPRRHFKQKTLSEVRSKLDMIDQIASL